MAGLVRASALADITVPIWEMLDDDRARRRKVYRPQARTFQLALDDDDEPDEASVEDWHKDWMGRIANGLAAEYPGHGQMVRMAAWQGIVTIDMPPILVSPNCVIVNLVKESNPVRCAIRLFGELLERFRLKRESFNAADVHAVIRSRSQADVRRGRVPE